MAMTGLFMVANFHDPHSARVLLSKILKNISMTLAQKAHDIVKNKIELEKKTISKCSPLFATNVIISENLRKEIKINKKKKQCYITFGLQEHDW